MKSCFNSFKEEKQARKIRKSGKTHGEETASPALAHRQMKVVHQHTSSNHIVKNKS